jgi:polyphosphate kinase 2 (PPK2 family)
VILLKYWLEVGPEEQTKRLRERARDGRKLWKLTSMDLKSYRHWDDYTRARDEMFAASDTADSPWYVVDAHDQRRARLNCIAHFLKQIPYQEIPREAISLPDRQISEVATKYPFRHVPAIY